VNLRHVNVKLRIKKVEATDLEPLIPAFHRWIQGKVFDELLLDIADYRHVPDGPGVVLIGHQADYAVDNTDGLMGVRYNRKAPLGGNNHDRLAQAARSALDACQRLELEPSLNGKIQFDGQHIEVFMNDRLEAPNTDATREATKSELSAFFKKLFQGVEFSLSHHADPRRLFGVSAKSSRRFSVTELLKNLAA
jgi:hypothetical protein